MADTKYSVSWDAYQKSICNGLSSLQQRGEFVDMTLAAEGHHVKVHQMIMSLVSPYIRDLIGSAACPHPVIFLNKMSYQTLHLILQYAYTGEVVVSNERLQEFLAACKELHIRGLESMQSLETANYGAQIYTKTNVDKPSEISQTPIFNKKKPAATSVESPQEEEHNVFKSDESHIDYSMVSDHDDDVSQNPFEDIEELKTTNKSIKTMATKNETEIKYSISNMGTAQLVLNRYLFFLRSARKNGQDMWRCINYKRDRCRAYVIVQGRRIILRACAHNHPYHDKQILKRLRNRNMFSSINEVNQAIDKKKNEQAKTELASKDKQAEPDQAEVLEETDNE